MKITIIDGDKLTPQQLNQTGELLFLTDEEIYPAAFDNAHNMGKVFPKLAALSEGMFASGNILAALNGDTVCGALVGCRRAEWKKGTLAGVFRSSGLSLPSGAINAEENYFVYESEHESGDYVLCLCVAPEYRRRGIGEALLTRYLEDREEVSLECLRHNLPAMALYRKCGFSIAEEYLGYAAPGNPPVSVYKLIRRISRV